MTTALSSSVRTATVSPEQIADLAVTALHDEADLTPKPGLIDRRGTGAHTDMTLDMLHTSAETLRSAFSECADAATQLPVGQTLRARIGAVGRSGERAMLAATGGVNTHRGALWALGLLATAAGAGGSSCGQAAALAARLARIPDPSQLKTAATPSHGARVRRCYHVAGAPGQARSGFPHVIYVALPALRATVGGERDPSTSRLQALLAVMARLDDTCLLHRGGAHALAAVQTGARRVLAGGGITTAEGRQRLSVLDELCCAQGLSPGGAGDLLAAALFLDSLYPEGGRVCRT